MLVMGRPPMREYTLLSPGGSSGLTGCKGPSSRSAAPVFHSAINPIGESEHMSWSQIKLSEVSPNQEPIPVGSYTFQLVGAELDGNGKISCKASIVTEGPDNGRRIGFSYPDPSLYDWSPRMLKRLEIALGLEQDESEDVVAFLNRAVVAGERFNTDVTHTKNNEGTDQEVVYSNLNIFNVTPAA